MSTENTTAVKADDASTENDQQTTLTYAQFATERAATESEATVTVETTHDTRIALDTLPDTGDSCYCPHCEMAVKGDYNHRTGRRDCPQCCGGVVVTEDIDERR